MPVARRQGAALDTIGGQAASADRASGEPNVSIDSKDERRRSRDRKGTSYAPCPTAVVSKGAKAFSRSSLDAGFALLLASCHVNLALVVAIAHNQPRNAISSCIFIYTTSFYTVSSHRAFPHISLSYSTVLEMSRDRAGQQRPASLYDYILPCGSVHSTLSPRTTSPTASRKALRL